MGSMVELQAIKAVPVLSSAILYEKNHEEYIYSPRHSSRHRNFTETLHI
jgi:hypothetical protein